MAKKLKLRLSMIQRMGAMKNRIILFSVLIAAFAAIATAAAVIAGRETAGAVLEDAVH